MSQTLHQIYQNKAIVLTKTMVVKFHKIAEAINANLVTAGYTVDQNNPASWKYYLNMFGEYHQYDHDRLSTLSGGKTKYMQIKVAGESQPVDADFTKDNLFGTNGDIAVANEYRFNTNYYNALVNQYPEFEDLILGILNPVSPEISIPAENGEILYCGGYLKTLLPSGYYHYVRQDYGPLSDNFLIETNEENLIYVLQDYLNGFLNRWWNSGYAVTHNLFHATFLGILYLSIPQILGNIRLGNAKTSMAHSFHIREHLESFGNLGWVTEYLSKGVLLWLYRNIVWLNANAGKTKTFNAIIDNVLTPTNIPISEHRLRHDLEEQNENTLTPNVYLEKRQLNLGNTKTTTRVEILDCIEQEISLATENYYDQEGQSQTVIDQSRYSMYDNLATKVLESTVIDNSNKIPVTKEDIGLNLWVFSASRGLYRGTVIFTNPLTNDRTQMTPLNAYILAFYCFNKGWANFEFEDIPTMYARLIHRSPTESFGDDFAVKPTLADVRRGVIRKFITDEEMTDILGTFVPKYTHSSTASFAQEVVDAHAESMRKYYRYCRIEDAHGRAYGEWVAHKCYWYDIPCPLTTKPTKYADWLRLQGIEFTNFTRTDYITLATAIVKAAIGVDLNASDALRNRQSAALAVLKHFSSYTIQIIQNTVASEAYWLDWKTSRLTNFRAKAHNLIKAQYPKYSVEEHWSIHTGPIWLKLYLPDQYRITKERLTESIDLDLTTGTNLKHFKTAERSRARLPMFTITTVGQTDIDTGGIVPLMSGISEPLTGFSLELGDDLMTNVEDIDETPVIASRSMLVTTTDILVEADTNVIWSVDTNLSVTTKLSGEMLICKPVISAKETMAVNIVLDDVITIFDHRYTAEQLNVKLSLTDSMSIVNKVFVARESLNLSIIPSTGLKVIDDASPSADQLTTAISLDSEMYITK